MFIIEILEIGQLDVNDAIQLLQSFKAIIAVGVVDQRDIQPLRHCFQQGFNYLRHEMRWRNHVDIMAAVRSAGEACALPVDDM